MEKIIRCGYVCVCVYVKVLSPGDMIICIYQYIRDYTFFLLISIHSYVCVSVHVYVCCIKIVQSGLFIYESNSTV